jgi:hypothetical protein
MKRLISAAAVAALLLMPGALNGNAQGRTTFTGTVLTYGSGLNTRTTTNPFTLRITGETSDAEAARLLNVLQNSGQDALLDAIKGEDLGSLTIGGRLAPRINVVRVDEVGGKQRIRVAFARWMTFAELRGSYRTTDYPFSYMEIIMDPRTGKGDGTFIAAAKVRFRTARNEVEIEDFGTFPSRLMGVKMRGAPLP